MLCETNGGEAILMKEILQFRAEAYLSYSGMLPATEVLGSITPSRVLPITDDYEQPQHESGAIHCSHKIMAACYV